MGDKTLDKEISGVGRKEEVTVSGLDLGGWEVKLGTGRDI